MSDKPTQPSSDDLGNQTSGNGMKLDGASGASPSTEDTDDTETEGSEDGEDATE